MATLCNEVIFETYIRISKIYDTKTFLVFLIYWVNISCKKKNDQAHLGIYKTI